MASPSSPSKSGSPPSPSIGGSSGTRRASNASGSEKFGGLMNQKRNSIDAAAAARRASFHDQKPAAGMFGSMWAKFTTGHEGK